MFKIIFSTVIVMLVYIIIGFVLCKTRKVTVSHTKSLSAILIYVLSPAMIINSFLQLEYSKEDFIKIGKCFVVTFGIQLMFLGILYFIFKNKYSNSKYRILSAGAALGNVGFMGMPLVASVFPDKPIVLCYSSANVLSMNLIVFTVGIFFITNDKKYISIKSAILNPTSIAIIVALPLYIFKIKFPNIVMDFIGLFAKMVTPICMMILGIRLASVKLREMFTEIFAYVTCLLKLVIFPIFVYFVVRWIPFLDNVIKISIIILASTPSGAIIESLAEMHECEQEFAANVVLLTTLITIVTIPIMTNFLIF